MNSIDVDAKQIKKLSEIFNSLVNDQNDRKLRAAFNTGFQKALQPMLRELFSSLRNHIHEGNLLESIDSKREKYGTVGGVLYNSKAPHLHIFAYGTEDRQTKKGVNRGISPAHDLIYKVIEKYNQNNLSKSTQEVVKALEKRIDLELRKVNVR